MIYHFPLLRTVPTIELYAQYNPIQRQSTSSVTTMYVQNRNSLCHSEQDDSIYESSYAASCFFEWQFCFRTSSSVRIRSQSTEPLLSSCNHSDGYPERRTLPSQPVGTFVSCVVSGQYVSVTVLAAGIAQVFGTQMMEAVAGISSPLRTRH